jgi:hypothetical protein
MLEVVVTNAKKSILVFLIVRNACAMRSVLMVKNAIAMANVFVSIISVVLNAVIVRLDFINFPNVCRVLVIIGDLMEFRVITREGVYARKDLKVY